MSNITVLIPTSPIPSHPSSAIIEETIRSVRRHLPDAPIMILFDAVREEQKDKFIAPYLEYLNNLVSKTLTGDPNVLIVPFMQHAHQIGMVRRVLEKVTTPAILFMEHDTPLVFDYEIPFSRMIRAVRGGEVNLIRLLHEAHIHPEHEHLMLESIEVEGIPLRKTIQFSARPHVASKTFYESLVARFSVNANCFIEDLAHSICQTDPWDVWRMAIFTPEGNQKRSYHTDGRAGENKFDERQVF